MDKITRLSVINEYEKGGLKMIDLETMITSLRLTCMVKKNIRCKPWCVEGLLKSSA